MVESGLLEPNPLSTKTSIDHRHKDSLGLLENPSSKLKLDCGQSRGSRRSRKYSTKLRFLDGEDMNQLKLTSLQSTGRAIPL